MTKLLLPSLLGIVWGGWLTLHGVLAHQHHHPREGFFNSSSYVSLYSPIALNRHIGLSFKTCKGGVLFSQRSSSHYSIGLEVRPEGLVFTVTILAHRYEARISANLLDNEWHTVNILYRQGNLTISTSGHQQVIANSSYNSEILSQSELSNDNAVLLVGKGFIGCILEGPSIVFNATQMQDHEVDWGPCPLPPTGCGLVNHCAHEPCMTHGRCILLPDRYLCQCTPRYSGTNCQIDNGPPCDRSPCKNNGRCVEDKNGDFTCYCPQGFAGKECDYEVSSHVCNNSPCQNNGTCRPIGVAPNMYTCDCEPGFEGKDCETNINECLPSPCQHGGTCIDGINNYTCFCGRTGYTGPKCEININECDNNPCLNNGICFDNYGGYTCQCIPGFGGQNCELKLSECASNPCNFANSLCADTNLSFQCICKQGFTGAPPNCTPIDICQNADPCQNGATCRTSHDTYLCVCPPGYTGELCDSVMDWCEPCANGGLYMKADEGYFCLCKPGYTGRRCSVPIACEASPCKHASACFDFPGGYFCACEPGWYGRNCDTSASSASTLLLDCTTNVPCLNGGVCTLLTHDNTFTCVCEHSYTGPHCEMSLDECVSSPCQNGGTCYDGPAGYYCNCTADFMGPNCESHFDACALKPCLNNATCIPKSDMKDYYCECGDTGFEGIHCENNINDCVNQRCPEGKVCIDGINTFRCVCANGLSGPDCNQAPDSDHCTVGGTASPSSVCRNGGTCTQTPFNITCTCPQGFKGDRCELDINECDMDPIICNNGICVNQEGSYQCFCTPGFSGDNCDIDFDECLSHPCYNGATCENKINSFNCICTPGYKGKDCSINIDECESNPCVSGATCVDEIATFSCLCPPGLTGRLCETNIDDCASSPCQNNGVCIDGLNTYACNCSDTGYTGVHCEVNIDECSSNPCTNGANCRDLVKGYMCECYPGYTGVNCEMDINECESNPCQFGGTCKERSIPSNYHPGYKGNVSLNSVFYQDFDYATAAGYECFCTKGIVGTNCEININECDSSPCFYGTCVDRIDGYKCDCEDGYEGIHCEIEIDECKRYSPCVHGLCHDGKASYFCECEGKYGGKNCSVELTGCNKNECLNNGTCKPYLEKETVHKFNCSCPNGFQGHMCEKETTMSLNGASYVMVNTSREEGYDIQLRFKTTIPEGLLAIGKGSTFYILELSNGRLNLHSSLLNKWEGVFIGSGLNDSNWQKVFVAINSSHLVLAANEEQTIYPINLNEGANASHTSFPTTYLGGTISYLRRLTHGTAAFTGCMQDVMINGHWVLPQDMSSPPVSFVGVEVGCKREPQCYPNPCHSGGHCTDKWTTFNCTCERPYLGTTCQYNLTAATFGHENLTNSVVTVNVDAMARRAVRSIMDISMFIRTREPAGGIFYLGSKPPQPPPPASEDTTGMVPQAAAPEETIISAKLAGGELQVSIQFNNSTSESYTVAGLRLDNGYNHLIRVVRNVTLFQVKINGTEYFRKTISASGQLDLQTLQLGMLPPSRGGTDPNEPNFKGIIQDVQVSNGTSTMVLQLFPLSGPDLPNLQPFPGQVVFDPELVLEGVVSDDSCKDEPCAHGGTCTVTWNDFSCACTVGYKGKRCQEMEFCQVQDCPSGSECRNLNYGYECVANITLHDTFNTSSSRVLRYQLVRRETGVPLNDLSVTYRSRTGGSLLLVGPDRLGHYLDITVLQDQEVSIGWNMGFGKEEKQLLKESRDGDWTTVWLKVSDNLVSGGLRESALEGETSLLFSGNFSHEIWYTLVSSANLSVGGGDTIWNFEGDDSNGVEFMNSAFYESVSSKDSSSRQYKGCIGEVRIGGLLLPYFTPQELNSTNTSDRDHFQLIPGTSLAQRLGCTLCFDDECHNGGKCENSTESYLCDCTPGFNGDDCSENIDECLENDCKNNSTCIDGLANYTCQCQLGWGGSLWEGPHKISLKLAKGFNIFCGTTSPQCDIDLDECASSPCQNNATCIDHLARFECRCGPDFVGERCEQVKQVTCESAPCRNRALCNDIYNSQTQDNFTCICQENFVGFYCEFAFCEVKPCQNMGTCVSTAIKPVCECRAGFTGQLCETNIDECASNPCQHGGRCIDGVGNFTCDCSSTGYEDELCSTDVDECLVGLADCGPAGACQNTPGAFVCVCGAGYCGRYCNHTDLCQILTPCANEGTCVPKCTDKSDYECICTHLYTGKNCTETPEFGGTKVTDIALVVAPILIILLLAGLASLSVFLMMARKKRATRGTYSPSSQEYSNPRLELDNVIKPPPEERLI